jgi:hypothetical protein
MEMDTDSMVHHGCSEDSIEPTRQNYDSNQIILNSPLLHTSHLTYALSLNVACSIVIIASFSFGRDLACRVTVVPGSTASYPSIRVYHLRILRTSN